MRKDSDEGGICLFSRLNLEPFLCRSIGRLVSELSLGFGKKKERRKLFISKRTAHLAFLLSVFSLAPKDRTTWLLQSGEVPPGGARRLQPQPARSLTSTSALGRSCRN